MTLAIYAAAPASVDRAAADVIGERFFGQDGKKSCSNPKAENGQESPRHLLWRSQAPQNPEALTWFSWSGCPDLNRGPLRPERSALTKLRHSPSASQREAGQSPYPSESAWPSAPEVSGDGATDVATTWATRRLSISTTRRSQPPTLTCSPSTGM
jgi:hypothetical protein